MISEYITINPVGVDDQYIVYIHALPADGGGPPIAKYFGICRLLDFAKSPDALRNGSWHREFAGKTYLSRIHSVHENEFEAVKARGALIRETHMPKCNVEGTYVTSTVRKIRCMETGAIYRNQTELADAVDVAQSRVSNHMNKRKGFRTIRGLSYEYFYPDTMKTQERS